MEPHSLYIVQKNKGNKRMAMEEKQAHFSGICLNIGKRLHTQLDGLP